MKKPWQDTEKRHAKDFNAKQTPRSGGLWWAQGDSKNEQFLIDTKESKHERFSITSLIWKKIFKEALLESKIPILVVKFGKKGHEVVVIDKNDFITILDNL